MTSGQMINIDKSTVFFNKNVGEGKRRSIRRKLRNMKHVKQSRYPGHPSVIGS